ncbi:MAG: deoxyguanosinetriphosphate triphosphohydrolase [Acidobacteriota bacterium]|nr:deoxyguanosinetriphosphate triphosphohydrolase [Acidobacteriota bacterium]
MLEYLRFPVEASRGRRYPEPEHPYRSAFQRDRDRIIHCRAFRRLEHKTQVFAPALSDHFRNRLTHTIEVAQIARTVSNVLGLNEDFTEALALVHDVGHPPFAHAGEDALNRMMERYGEAFDHNIQSLRAVDSLEHRYPRFPGLNLTFEVREGIVKHSRDYRPGESEIVDRYQPELKPPIEAQLIDLADEIAYNSADLDDAYEAGLLSLRQIAVGVPVFAEILETVETQFPGATEREQFQESVRQLIDGLVSGLIEGTAAAARAANLFTVDGVRRHPARIAQFSPAAGATSTVLKRFLFANVYSSHALDQDRSDSVSRLTRMFEHFMRVPEDVPGVRNNRRSLHRAVCDYIAGMTDRYFFQVYSDIFA